MLCYSTGSLPDAFAFSDISGILGPSPFRGVELVVTAAMLERAADGPYWKGVRDSFREKGLAFRNVHLGAPHLLGPEAHRPGLSSLMPSARARKVRAAAACMEIAAALDCPHVTVTSGLSEGGALRALQEKAFRGALGELVAALPPELDILIEQEPEHVINSAEHLAALGGEFPGRVFANFDVGHSHVVGEDIGACIRKLGPLIRNIHLEDIRGRVHAHKLFGDGDVDFDSVFQALRDIGYRGDYTPDLYPFKDDPEGAMEASARFLRRHEALTPAL